MNDDEFFDTQFPGALSQLQSLRAADTEFDQICRDYQEVFVELAQSQTPGARLHPRYFADLAECVSDLRSSIEVRLQT